MQRNQGRFDPQPGQQHEKDQDQLNADFLGRHAQDPALRELHRADERLQPDRSDQEQGPAAHRVGEIDLGPVRGIGRAAMCDQGIGRQGQDLVEDHEGQQVSGQGDADRRRNTDAEEAEESAAVRRMLEIADRIDGRHQPQERGQGDEEHRQGVGPEHQVQAGCERPASLVTVSVVDAADHPDHQPQFEQRAGHVQDGAQAMTFFPQEEDQHARDHRAQQDRGRQPGVEVHPKAPCSSKTHSGCAAIPSPKVAISPSRSAGSSVRASLTKR